MPTCHDLKLNEVYTCPDCGLEVTVTKECHDAQEHTRRTDCCNPDSEKECVLVCCGVPLRRQ